MVVLGFPGAKEPWCQCRWHETWARFKGQKDPLVQEMATHSSILAWRIPWTEEPGRLQSMGSQRVEHSWSDLACTHGSSIFSFLRNLHAVSHQQCMSSLFSTSLHAFVIYVIFDDSWINKYEIMYLIVILICTFLMIRDVEHFSCACWPSAFLF